MRKFIILLGLLVILSGCSIEVNENNGEVVDIDLSEKSPFKGFYAINIDDFSPNKVVNFEQKAIMRNLHEGLYKIDENGELEMGIAEEITVTEEEGYLVYDILLKEDVKFHDETELTPEDVQYSIFRFTGLLTEINETDFEFFKYWVNLFDGDVDDEFNKGKVEIHGSNRIILYVDDFYGEEITSSLLADTFIIPMEYSLEEQITNPVGLGPYKFDSMDEEGTIFLSKFDEYYEEKPQVPEIELYKISSKEARNEAFENGELDILDSYPGKDKEEDFKPLSGDIYSLVFNIQNDTYKSKPLRRALSSSVNKKLIQSQLFGVSGGVVETPLSPLLNSYISDIEVYNSFIPSAATEFIENNPQYRELPLNIAYIEEDNLSRAIGEYIVESMNYIGFNVRLNPLPWDEFRVSVIRDRNYEMAIMRYSGNIDPHKILDRFTTKNVKNISDYYNFDYNTLMREEMDNFTGMINMVKSEIPELFLLDPGESYIMSSKFTTPTVYPYPYLDFSSIEYK